jgi:microcompartment protein CcmL/EutN
VQSSVDAGVAAAKRAGELVTAHVIARPHRSVEKLLHQGPTRVVRALAD